MDAVILAGGRGTRVASITAPFMKPLLKIDGVPLVRRAVELAYEVGVKIPVVVTAPENTLNVAHALADLQVAIAVQLEPLGPGHALLTGLNVVPTSYARSFNVLVLLSDNVVTSDDVRRVTQGAGLNKYDVGAVGVRFIERELAERYTRYEDGAWIEKQPVTSDIRKALCWVGPFVGNRRCMTNILADLVAHPPDSGEVPIGPYLNVMLNVTPGNQPMFVHVKSVDVGTVDSYMNYKYKDTRVKDVGRAQ